MQDRIEQELQRRSTAERADKESTERQALDRQRLFAECESLVSQFLMSMAAAGNPGLQPMVRQGKPEALRGTTMDSNVNAAIRQLAFDQRRGWGRKRKALEGLTVIGGSYVDLPWDPNDAWWNMFVNRVGQDLAPLTKDGWAIYTEPGGSNDYAAWSGATWGVTIDGELCALSSAGLRRKSRSWGVTLYQPIKHDGPSHLNHYVPDRELLMQGMAEICAAHGVRWV